MSTPIPLHSTPDSPPPQPHHHHQISPTPSTPPLHLPLPTNVTNSKSHEPPHYTSLIGKTLNLDKHSSPILIDEVIAEGGFGVIFLSKSTQDKVKYALKRVVVNSKQDYEGILGEVAIMTIISPKTPHLLPSLSHMITHYPPSTYEIQNLMPLCRQTLLQIATQKLQKSVNFEVAEILQILTDVCKGLQYLHNSTPPIIHRDVKIENILVLEDNYVLSDFGSATVKYWDPQVDSVNYIQEDLDKNTTLQYRSPEMVDLYGGRGAISVASDVWAVGVVGFKLMSFKDPFESILAIQNRNLNWSTTKSRYPDHMILLVETLLAEHQSVRPTVEEVIRITTAGALSDWTVLQSAYTKITEDKKAREEAQVKKQSQAQQSANVVMETTVTPRQRPKRGNPPAVNNVSGGGSSSGNSIIPPVLAAPPRSPSNVSGGSAVDGGGRFFSPSTQQNTISPSPQPPTQTPSPIPSAPPQPPRETWTTPVPTAPQPAPPSTGGSYNPFDDDYKPPDSSIPPPPPSTDDTEYDVFANAPFDYFKYQPIMVNTASAGHYSDEMHQNQIRYAANNPFLYDHDLMPTHSYGDDLSNNNAAGVCNVAFEELSIGAGERAANSNNDS